MAGVVEEAFWAHLEERYPATRWWWSGVAPRTLFPEWSASAFAHEANRWLQLSRMTIGDRSPQGRSWGRFARTAAIRIHAGTWRRPAAPIRHARTNLRVMRLLDPFGATYRWDQVLDYLSKWLMRIQDMSSLDYWTEVELDNELRALGALVDELLPRGEPLMGWEVRRAQILQAVLRYRKMVDSQHSAPIAPMPWGSIAHLHVHEWQAQRQTVAKAPYLGPPLRERQLLRDGHKLGNMDIQYVLVPYLRAEAYVRLENHRPTIFYGPSSSMGLILGQIFSWWITRGPTIHKLTWALSHPIVVDGWLQAIASIMARESKRWIAVHYGVLDAWLNERQVRAAVDAWAWLESGTIEEIGQWLQRIGYGAREKDWVPQMILDPGMFLVPVRDAKKIIRRATKQSSLEHELWEMGPIPVDILD